MALHIMIPNGSCSGTQSVVRAISLLKLFSDAQPEWSLSDLARAAELNKTTAHRLLTALERAGMLARSRHTGAYRLGPEIIALGGRALRSNDLRSAGLAELETLAARVGEAATLEILVGDQVLILEEIPASYLIAPWQTIGTRNPAHATSTGKLLLAFLPPAERAAALHPPLARLTEQTITDLDALERQLECIRACGHAAACGELEPDYVAVERTGAQPRRAGGGGCVHRRPGHPPEQRSPARGHRPRRTGRPVHFAPSRSFRGNRAFTGRPTVCARVALADMDLYQR